MQYIFKQIPGSFIIQLRQCIVPPPAVIGTVVWPCPFIMERKVFMVRTFPVHIGSLLIPLLVLIDPFPVHPFIERAAMIEYAVQYHFHSPPVSLCHHLRKQFIAGLQIYLIGHTVNVSGGVPILLSMPEQFSLIRHNLSDMRIYIIVILNIIFMIGRRYKQRIKINHIYPKILQIIHLIQHALQIPAIKFTHTHGCRIFVPILHFYCVIANIMVFIRQYVIGRIPIIKAIHINLIHDGPFRPFRCLIAGYQAKVIMPVNMFLRPLKIKIACNLSCLHFKIITDFPVLQLHRMCVIVKQIIRLPLEH